MGFGVRGQEAARKFSHLDSRQVSKGAQISSQKRDAFKTGIPESLQKQRPPHPPAAPLYDKGPFPFL